jgi:hypothetical protein
MLEMELRSIQCVELRSTDGRRRPSPHKPFGVPVIWLITAVL